MPEFSGKYYTYSDLWWGTEEFLEVIDEKQEGALHYYSCMSVIVFSAFCLEAYMNQIGPHYFRTWNNSREDEGEIWLSPKEKLTFICRTLGINPDFGQRPFQSFIDIFGFRNLIAHGKSIDLEGYFTEGIPEIETEIQKKATWKFAHRYRDDTEEMIRLIHQKFIPNSDPFFVIGRETWGG